MCFLLIKLIRCDRSRSFLQIWVNATFVSSSQIVFQSSVDLRPYMYVVPPELLSYDALLRATGVQSSMSLQDCYLVLERMGTESRERGPLDARCLDLSISVLQIIIALGSADDQNKGGRKDAPSGVIAGLPPMLLVPREDCVLWPLKKLLVRTSCLLFV